VKVKTAVLITLPALGLVVQVALSAGPDVTPPAGQAVLGEPPAGVAWRPLEQLAPLARDEVAGTEGDIGIAVATLDPSAGYYEAKGDQAFHAASVVKVAIMLVFLDRLTAEGRDVNDEERELLEAMVTLSDNDAATDLWNRVGAGAGVAAYFSDNGIDGFTPDPEERWGLSYLTPKAVAILLSRLVEGRLLDEPQQRLAMDLMMDVAPSQRWGIADAVQDEGTLVGNKNGWYHDEEGWDVHSAAFISREGPPRLYVLAVMTNNQPTLEAGVELIEAVARLIHEALRQP